jgi:transposase-like protein
LSFRDVEDLLAERGILVSYETVRRWVNHFGPVIAADRRNRRPKPHMTWHLDEVLSQDGRLVYLWRAVDAEGEVLDVLVQTRRNRRAALKLMRKLLKKYGFVPDKLVTDDLRSYSAATRDLGIAKRHERGRWRNNRAENSHQPTRPPTTHSTSNAISPQQEHTEPSGRRPCRRGVKSLPRRDLSCGTRWTCIQISTTWQRPADVSSSMRASTPIWAGPDWMLLASLRSNRFEATDAVGKIEKMQDVGRAYANKWVEMTPFKAFL